MATLKTHKGLPFLFVEENALLSTSDYAPASDLSGHIPRVIPPSLQLQSSCVCGLSEWLHLGMVIPGSGYTWEWLHLGVITQNLEAQEGEGALFGHHSKLIHQLGVLTVMYLS